MKRIFSLIIVVTILLISGCSGGGAGSAASTTTPTIASSVPTGVTVVPGNSKITPSWTAVTGATSYNVYYGTTAGVTVSNGTKVASATSGTAINALTNGTTYYVVVTAVTSTGESTISSEVSATPGVLPPAPTGVTIVSGNAQDTLSWQAVTGATSYNVYYRTTPGVSVANGTKIANTSSGTAITSLLNGTEYYFVVTAVKNGLESAVSSEVGATPQASTSGVVSGLTISGGNGQSTLSWTAITGATSYNVYYRTTAGVTIANGTKVTGVTSGSPITGLTNGTMHYFVVTAMSNANTIENAISTEVSAKPVGILNLVGGAIQTPLTLAGTVTTVSTVDSTGAAIPLRSGGIFSTYGLTTDGTNLYVTTWYNYIKVVIATGVTTVINGPNGQVILADGVTTDGNSLYLAGMGTSGINKFAFLTSSETLVAGGSISGAAPGAVDGSALTARFNTPYGITTDGSNLYVADSGNHTIRKIVIATGVVTTLAGTAGLTGSTNAIGSAARFNNPTGITTDGTNLYVADTGNNLIRKIVIADGTVSTVAGGYLGLTYDGTGVGAKFTAPRGITTDGINLYVADTGAHIIRKVVIATGVVMTIAGNPAVAGNTNGTGSAALFSSPWSVTTDGTSLYVGDFTNSVIRKVQ
jgi:sugar lactone lactonase YvrE/fibronectin type 3 domain-containing protein